MQPMLATATDRVPAGADWVHEVKWDGMRVIAEIHAGAVTLRSRSGREVTASFPELARLGETFEDVVLDGEIVALEQGRPSFGALAERMHVRDSRRAHALAATRPITFMIFDLLRLFGQDLTSQPWSARRELLERLELRSPHWQVPPTYADGEQLLTATAEQGLEGIVSKRRAAAYAAGRRSPDWRKLPHRARQSVVVGGWRWETDSSTRLGALLVGEPDGEGGWRYLGRVGSGLVGAAGAALLPELQALPRAEHPFSNEVPREDVLGTTWTEPRLVVEVQALGRGSGGRLRQPAYIGRRHDVSAQDLQEAGDG